jgi:Acetyltransferase (GNAT) domain
MLEEQIGDVGLTCSWDWTEVWLDHFGDIVEHDFAVVSDGDDPCGIVLVTRGIGQKRSRVPVKTIHFGTAGEPRGDSIYVEYNRALIVPKLRPAAARALLESIQEDDSWDELRLDGFAPDEAEAFLAADPRIQPRLEPCPTVDLRAADRFDGDVLSILTSNTRYQVRRSIRAFGSVQGEWAQEPDEALDILDELIRLHQKRWSDVGRPGVFSSERFASFHRSLIERLFGRGWIVLFRARSPAETIGCLYSFVERENVLSYQLGLARFQDNKMKPGFVTHTLCMQSSYDRGLRDYNFLAGATPWKRELATTERQLVWGVASRRRLKLVVADALNMGKRLTDRLISVASFG